MSSPKNPFNLSKQQIDLTLNNLVNTEKDINKYLHLLFEMTNQKNTRRKAIKLANHLTQQSRLRKVLDSLIFRINEFKSKLHENHALKNRDAFMLHLSGFNQILQETTLFFEMHFRVKKSYFSLVSEFQKTKRVFSWR